MPKPRVTVVIPNYNYARFVGQAIDSALAQTYRDLEVLVIDNGSTDNSLEVLRGYGERIRVVAQDNRGQAGSRNRGIAEARGELIAFLDADDIWLPTKLEKQIPFFDRPEVGLVYCGVRIADAELRPIREIVPRARGRVLAEIASGVGAVVQGGESTAVIRRECFERVGLFDPELSISGGWDMFRRVACRYEIEVVPEPLTLYRQHGSNASLRVDIYEHDVFIRLAKLFSDPMAAEVHPLKRLSYGKTYLALAGSHLHARHYGASLKYLAYGLATWPPGIGYVAALPMRLLRRRRGA